MYRQITFSNYSKHKSELKLYVKAPDGHVWNRDDHRGEKLHARILAQKP